MTPTEKELARMLRVSSTTAMNLAKEVIEWRVRALAAESTLCEIDSQRRRAAFSAPVIRKPNGEVSAPFITRP